MAFFEVVEATLVERNSLFYLILEKCNDQEKRMERTLAQLILELYLFLSNTTVSPFRGINDPELQELLLEGCSNPSSLPIKFDSNIV